MNDVLQALAEAAQVVQEIRRADESADWSGWKLYVTDADGRVLGSIDLSPYVIDG